MINWSPELAKEIAKERCVFFLGSGVSASARDATGNSPPTWDRFMESATQLVRNDHIRRSVSELIQQRKFLIALEAIKANSNAADYNALLDRSFANPQYRASELHRVIYDLDARTVITTNFDKIYETYCNSFENATYAYKTISYSYQALADEIRSDTRLIIKAHGSIDELESMIFTRAQYHRAKRNNSSFYEILKALFLTNTVVFVGCGLDDPDIMLLLEDVRIAGRHTKPHYALVLEGERNSLLIADWKATYNIDVLEYGPDHAALATELQRLLEMVEQERAEATGYASTLAG